MNVKLDIKQSSWITKLTLFELDLKNIIEDFYI